MKFREVLPEFEIITKVSKFSNLHTFELDLNLANQIRIQISFFFSQQEYN